jgi:heme-degrading monooxygenase HmoA
MHTVLWSYRVVPGREAEFEALYRGDGDWAELFRHDPAYLGTELLRDTADGSRYLTIDRWHSRAAYETFLGSATTAYAALDRRGDAVTLEETRLGAIDD